jgi:hypothetical protein
MFNSELVKYNDKLYYIYRKFKSTSIKEGKINDVKDLWNCDIVLRTKADSDELLFLREISEIELMN